MAGDCGSELRYFERDEYRGQFSGAPDDHTL